MKNISLLSIVFIANSHANFNLSKSSASDTFEQQIIYHNGNDEKLTAGEMELSNWRNQYLNRAEEEIRTQYVKLYREPFPEETFYWIDEHGFKNSLLQATQVDARIIRNLDSLLKQLDTSITEEYANMLFAISVARRTYGIESVQFSNNRFSKPVDKNRQLSAEEREEKKIQEEFVSEIKTFMKTQNWNLNQTIDNLDSVLKHIKIYGKSKGYSRKKYYKDVKNVGTYLHLLNIKEGRVHLRQPYATAVEYIKHIADIRKQEVEAFTIKNSTIQWPNVFSYNNAPWPLFMPLAEMRPVDEMNWTWDRFKNENVEPKLRFRTYGNYRNDPEVLAPLMASVKYEKQSVQYSNYVGGVCGTMSMIGRDTYISLGIPSIGMGQPKHAAIMRYVYNDNNQSIIALVQSISTLYNSTPDWYFFEDNSFRMDEISKTKGEYQAGLALAMNQPMQKYLDSRTMVRVAKEKRGSEKIALLKKATDASVYNAEAWYDRFTAMGINTQNAKILIDEITRKLPSESDGYSEEKAPNKNLENEVVSASLSSSTVMYRDTVIGAIVIKLFKTAYDANLPLDTEYSSWIKRVNANNLYDLMKLYSFEAFESSGKDLKYLDADKNRSKELNRQERIKILEAKIDNLKIKIKEKELLIAEGNLSAKKEKLYKKKITIWQKDITGKQIKINALTQESILYLEYINGDGIK